MRLHCILCEIRTCVFSSVGVQCVVIVSCEVYSCTTCSHLSSDSIRRLALNFDVPPTPTSGYFLLIQDTYSSRINSRSICLLSLSCVLYELDFLSLVSTFYSGHYTNEQEAVFLQNVSDSLARTFAECTPTYIAVGTVSLVLSVSSLVFT